MYHILPSAQGNISIAQYTQFDASEGMYQQYEFEKAEVPDDKDEKLELVRKLGKYNVSLSQYQRSLLLKEIKP